MNWYCTCGRQFRLVAADKLQELWECRCGESVVIELNCGSEYDECA